jgi:hypothetical protein
MYREYLAALRPFSAEVAYGPGTWGLPPDIFSTTVAGTTYLGILNPDAELRAVDINLVPHGLPADTWMVGYDPESGEAFATRSDLATIAPAEHLRLLVLRVEPGVIWGDRSTVTEYSGATLRVHVLSSGFGAGRVLIYAPDAAAVDGVPPHAWSLDEALGLLTVELTDGAAYDLQVTLSHP